MAGGIGGEVDLLVAASNGTGPEINMPRFAHLYEEHLRTLFVWGTFDSANIALQISPDETNWFDVANADTITADTTLNVEFRAPFVRCNVTGGGGSESINAKLL